MLIVRGKDAHPITRAELDELVGKHESVTIDLGAGDGKWAYRHAQAHASTLVIAVEPVRENVREMSAKAAKKPGRGGLPNLLYVQGSVEQMPPELASTANEVYITLPWGSLMRGVILAEKPMLSTIASLASAGACLRIVLNTRIFEDPVPLEARDLPEVTPDHIRALTTNFAEAGLTIEEARWMDADEIATLGTTWAKRLSHRAPPRSVYVRLLATRQKDRPL